MDTSTSATPRSPRAPWSGTVRRSGGPGDTVRRHPAPAPVGDPGRRAPVVLALGLVIGLAWGAATSGLQTLLPTSGLANAVGPWVVPAFVVGALSRRPWVAVAAGVLACSGEVAGYYLVSAARGFGVNPSMVAVWACAGLVGGTVFGAAGWCWRRATTVRAGALGAALLGGVFLAEGVVQYGLILRYPGNAVLFCVIGALLAVVLGAGSPAARAAGARGRGVGAAAIWLLVVLALGAAGVAGMHELMSSPAGSGNGA
ncbi:DUF6518 family protein [uncultured Cellulomonas sp.]|uniref:DUF6518 family protein n=1 Tax=uncultured Cellulomonas sp. TaxID=189682 RepID=UPI002638E535|nr:DUF6518 family protein [uncultured Cellulomonas sp.]